MERGNGPVKESESTQPQEPTKSEGSAAGGLKAKLFGFSATAYFKSERKDLESKLEAEGLSLGELFMCGKGGFWLI